jgi:hypothetical protein
VSEDAQKPTEVAAEQQEAPPPPRFEPDPELIEWVARNEDLVGPRVKPAQSPSAGPDGPPFLVPPPEREAERRTDEQT